MRKILSLFSFLLLFTAFVFGQNRSITGKVTDGAGIPVANASVKIKGTRTGVAADNNGQFSILAKTGDELVITAVNFEAATVTVGSGNSLTVPLKASSTTGDEVIVTSYARVKKSQYSGAVTQVTSDKINFVPVASFDQILQGRAPGILITTGSGQPGASARVQIRGASSINGGNGPLYVVDGMPMEAGVFQSLNPNDFETVDILKDAVATAQYGNRGSNGVIVATTKKGREGKMVISYTGQYGVTEPGKQQFEMMNSTEILNFQESLGKFINNGLPGWANSPLNPANAGLSPAAKAQQAAILDSLKGINTNWKDIYQRNGSFRSHDLSLSGGNGGTRYYLSTGIYDEDGIGLRSDLTRYTLRANIDNKGEKVTIGFNSSVGYTKRDFIESENGIALANPFAAAYLALPYHKLFRPDGKPDVGAGKTGPNAYDRILSTSNFNNQIKMIGSFRINYDITPNIYVGSFSGIDYRVTDGERSIYPNTYAANTAGFPTGPPSGSTIGGGSFAKNYSSFLQYNTQVNAGYKRIFGGIHDMDVKFVSEYTREKQTGFNYTGYGINNKLVNTPAGITPGTAANALIPGVGGFNTGRALYAVMALARYTYKDKYTFNGSLRRDASSQLAKENRWTTFYAAGVTWNVLKESFANNWSWINELRIRTSYGTAANADGFTFGNFGYLPTYGGGTYAGGQTIVPTNAGNPDVTWEKLATTNIGVDFSILKRRLYGSIEIYQKKLTDGIVDQTLPAESGFLTQPVNAAVTTNKGIEFGITGEIIKTQNFYWSLTGNVSYNKNNIEDLGQVNEFEQGTEIVRVGLPIGSHYVVKWGGVDAATGAPLYYTKDGKLTSVFSDNNTVAEFGTYNAPWIGGFNTSIRIFDFSIDALFSFQQGFSRFNNQDFFQLNHAFALQGFNLRREMLTMWQKPGDVTNIQSPLYQRQFVSKDVQDASYTRFRNLTVSYNFTRRFLEKTKVLSAARVYVQGQNLYTWTKWTGFDPEDDNNIAGYEYPVPRTINIGISVSLK